MRSIQELNDISNYKSIFVFTHDLEDFYNKFGDKISSKIGPLFQLITNIVVCSVVVYV